MGPGIRDGATRDERYGLPATGVEVLRAQFLPDGRANSKNAAIYLGKEPKTMTAWRAEGKGPRWIKVGGEVFYFKDDLDRFIRGGE